MQRVQQKAREILAKMEADGDTRGFPGLLVLRSKNLPAFYDPI